jgi:hypothetical protein
MTTRSHQRQGKVVNITRYIKTPLGSFLFFFSLSYILYPSSHNGRMTPNQALTTFLNIDHLVQAAIEYSDADTKARLMRVNKHFYSLAAKSLYHTVGLFEGAFKLFFIEAGSGNLPITKNALLASVRVVTIGSHDAADCSGCAHHFAVLSPDTLRIVPTPTSDTRCRRFCENLPVGVTYNGCPILDWTSPRKLVFRNNLGGSKLPLPALFRPHPCTKDIVLVFPNTGSILGASGSMDDFEYGNQFTSADRLKIVFWPTWDTSGTVSPTCCAKLEDLENDVTPVFVENAWFVLVSLGGVALAPWGQPIPPIPPTLTLIHYGFATVPLTAAIPGRASNIVNRWCEAHPDQPVDLHHIIKVESQSGYSRLAMNPPYGTWLVGPCPREWRTIGNYLRNVQDRHHELDAYD